MVHIESTVKARLPRIPYLKIADKILKKEYELSLVFIGEARSRQLNYRFRKKDRPTNILSFHLSRNEGEIFMNIGRIRKEAIKLGVSMPAYTAYIFIHGLLHLKGLPHGSRMESEERKFLKLFKYSIFLR